MNPANKNLAWLDCILIVLVVVCTNPFNFICELWGMPTPRSCELGLVPWQTWGLGAASLPVIFILFKKYWNRMKMMLRNSLALVFFVLLGMASILWSVSPFVTFFRFTTLLFLLIIACYVALRFSADDLVVAIVLVSGAIAFASLLLAVVRPELVIMSNYPYEGLWRGIYWHKNYFGPAMAMGCVASAMMLFTFRKAYSVSKRAFALVTMTVCAVLAVSSDSASGLIALTIQAGLFLLLLFWLKWGHRLDRLEYIGLFGVLGSILIILALNLDFFFDLFGRTANMTGRVPLWGHLWEYAAKRLVWGYGLSAFWYQPGINEEIQSLVGWPYPVGISDNGYLDILLGLGVVGIALLLGMLALGIWRAFRFGLSYRNLASFFPLFLLIHIALINISLSNFLESESFYWFLLTVALLKVSSLDAGDVEG